MDEYVRVLKLKSTYYSEWNIFLIFSPSYLLYTCLYIWFGVNCLRIYLENILTVKQIWEKKSHMSYTRLPHCDTVHNVVNLQSCFISVFGTIFIYAMCHIIYTICITCTYKHHVLSLLVYITYKKMYTLYVSYNKKRIFILRSHWRKCHDCH